jgi:predicted NBD/HSP70 family sugar kinase
LDALLDLSIADDDAAVRVIHDGGRAVGRVLADICNVINPAVVVVGGELSRAGQPLVSGIREAIDRYALPASADAVAVTAGDLRERAVLVGALALAIGNTDRLRSTRLPALQA